MKHRNAGRPTTSLQRNAVAIPNFTGSLVPIGMANPLSFSYLSTWRVSSNYHGSFVAHVRLHAGFRARSSLPLIAHCAILGRLISVLTTLVEQSIALLNTAEATS